MADDKISNSGSEKEKLEYVIPGKEENSKGKKEGQLDVRYVSQIERYAGNVLDNAVNPIEAASNEGYRKIADRIVDISEDYLDSQHEKKSPLRKKFMSFFTKLLGFQFAFLLLFIIFDSFHLFGFDMSEYLLTTYIVSVFAETLASIGVMLAFSFTTKEESSIVEVLTTVIQNYQTYSKNGNNDKQNK